ncbi:microsomal triacylglycerol transfer protein isoform X2 [Tachypleus tridentatus]|uniref:microsomal triacylglycerol transfer protein isoform X2 n=1 Tax=Tachypleus tridentatus TaxID=6853 RepID=UPI003FD0D904
MKLFALSFTVTIFFTSLGSGILHPTRAVTSQYQLGTTYIYQYNTHVKLNEAKSELRPNKNIGKSVGYKLRSQVKVKNIWQNPENTAENLVKIEFLEPQLLILSSENFVSHDSLVEKHTQYPLFVLWKKGRVEKVFTTTASLTLTNLKKGVASLLQLPAKQGLFNEEDVSGRCKVSYDQDGPFIKKKKHYCVHPKREGQFSHSNEVQSATVTTNSETVYELAFDGGIVKSAEGNENIQMYVNIWSDAAIYLDSKFNLVLKEEKSDSPGLSASNLDDALKILMKGVGMQLVEESIISQPEKHVCKGNCKTVPGLVKDYRKELDTGKIATLKSATAFLRLLERFRGASKKNIVDILKSSKNKSILPQLLDLIAASQTENSLQAAIETLDLTGENIDIPERFFLGLSVASHPSHMMLSDLMKLTSYSFQNPKLKVTLMMTLGALMRTYCRKNQELCDSKVVQTINGYFEKELAACRGDPCQLMYLRALKNAALPTSMPTFLKYAKRGGKCAVVALGAIAKIGQEYLTEEVMKVLEGVYNQVWSKQDSTARAIAAELILKNNPSELVLSEFLQSLAVSENAGLSRFLLAKLYDLITTDLVLRSKVEKLFKNSKFGNYNILSQRGASTAFTKYFIANRDVNATYSVNLELGPSGMLKTSTFDVAISNKESQLKILSVGLFAGGLGSFAGEEEVESEESEEATAGMELNVLGVELRPYTFFTGTGELMGLVWSGAGSERTPALQGNLLIMDQSQHVVLQNGLVVDVSLRGVLSIDLSGSVQISLWNRNSQSVVTSSGALLLQGSASVDTAFAKSRVEFSLGGESYIDFLTDTDFYGSPLKMCIQMTQPQFLFKHNVRKYQSLPGTQHQKRILKKRTTYIPAKSYALNKKNFELCASMFPQQ